MRRLAIYGSVALVMFGCRRAAVRGADHGCDDGILMGEEDARLARESCSEPQPVAVGCGVPEGGMFRKAKYKDAYRGSFQECYYDAYSALWNVEMYNDECDGTLDTAAYGYDAEEPG